MRVSTLFLFVTATAFAQPRLEHIWGRISAMTKSGVEVDQNFNADPQSGYRRGKRQITFNSKTKFEESAREDLRVGRGRTVDILGLETTISGVQAARVIVYEGNRPVRMRAGGRVITPDGSVHVGKYALFGRPRCQPLRKGPITRQVRAAFTEPERSPRLDPLILP